MGCECEDPCRIRLEIVRSNLQGIAVATVEASRLSHGRGSSEMHRGRHVNVSPSSCVYQLSSVRIASFFKEKMLSNCRPMIGSMYFCSCFDG